MPKTNVKPIPNRIFPKPAPIPLPDELKPPNKTEIGTKGINGIHNTVRAINKHPNWICSLNTFSLVIQASTHASIDRRRPAFLLDHPKYVHVDHSSADQSMLDDQIHPFDL